MEERSAGVLGASGMLPQPQKDKGGPETPTVEMTSEEIDVEGDAESGEGGPTPSQECSEVKEKLCEEDESGSLREDIVGETLGFVPAEQEFPSDEKSEKQGNDSVEKISTCMDVMKEKLHVETEKLGKAQAEMIVSESGRVSQSKNTGCMVENIPDPSSAETLKVREDGAVFAMSASGLATAMKSESGTKTSTDKIPTAATRPKKKGAEHEAKKPVGVPKLKSFEDAFKESIGKLNVEITHPRKIFKQMLVDSASSQPTSKAQCPQHKGRVIDLKDEEEEMPVEETKCKSPILNFISEKKMFDGPVCIIDLSSRRKCDSTDNQMIDVDVSDEEPVDPKDIDNFSSDSSSTIIDMGLAAKESAEEEIPGKSSKSFFITHSKADLQDQSSHPAKPVIKEEMEFGVRAKIKNSKSKPNSTSDTKLQDEAAKEQISLPTNQPLKDDASTVEGRHERSVFKKEKEAESSQSEQSLGKVVQYLEKSDSAGYKGIDDQNTEITRNAKQKTGSPSEELSYRRRELPRKRSLADRSELKLETTGDGKVKLRERSKSDEGQNVFGKKYRISKHGIILQPGTKLEAMDYSRKWYMAKIVSIDETDSTVLIHFEGWNSRFDEWLEFDSDRLRPLARVSARRETAKEVKALGGYKVGDEVLARWSDCRYYPAKILGIKTNGSYRVLFYDGIEKTVMGINVRDMPDSLKSQNFFSNLEHQFRALVNKKRRSSKDTEGSASGSRPSSPIQPPPKRRHSSASQPPATKPAKRSRHDPDMGPKVVPHKGQRIVQTPVLPSPTAPLDHSELLPSPTSSEASEQMSPLEHGTVGGKKRYRYRELLILDKNSGLNRDPRRLIAPKELVIDFDHNKYKCDVPDCGKGFRKASLLEYHKKYYHINKPATSTSAMTAAKNAVTRSRKRLSTSTMAPGTSKMRRTESLDRSPAKVASRTLRTSAPSIMTSSYKRPLPSPKLDAPTRPSHLRPSQPPPSQLRPSQPRPSQPRPSQLRPSQLRPSQPRPSQPRPNQLRSSQPQPIQPQPIQPQPSQPRLTQPPKVVRSGQFLKRQSISEARKSLTTIRTELPIPTPEPTPLPAQQQLQQTLIVPKAQEPEVIPKVTERSCRVSGSSLSKEDKPNESKWEICSTSVTEKITVLPKMVAPVTETETKMEEPTNTPPSETLETKPQDEVPPDTKDDLQAKVVGNQIEGDQVPPVTASHDVLKKERRSRPHKKHKRHKARTRDRRTREQSRSDRRRAAERAKQRRQEQQLKEPVEGLRQKPDDVMEWTAKYLPPKPDKNLPHSPAQSLEDPNTRQDVVDSSTTEEGGPKEMISCICRNSEEEGFMIQCEVCFGWQHGGCVGLTEHTVPKQYICSLCIHPENLRTHARHRYNQNWFLTGKLPSLIQSKEPTEESSDQTDSMLKTHQLMADMINVTEALDGLQHKLKILKSDNHPDLKLWSYHWGLKDETSPLTGSAHNQQLHSSLEEADLQQTSAETSTLTESMRSDVVIDSVTEEVVLEDNGMGTSEVQQKSSDTVLGNQPEIGGDHETGAPQEGDKHATDGQNAFGDVSMTLSTSAENQKTDDATHDSNSVNFKESPMQVMTSGQAVTRPHLPFIPDSSALLSSKPADEPERTMTPTGKLTARLVPDSATSAEAVKDVFTTQSGKPGMAKHDGKTDGAIKDRVKKDDEVLQPNNKPLIEDNKPIQSTEDVKNAVTNEPGEPGTPKHGGKARSAPCKMGTDVNSSDDEPLIKFTNKPIESGATVSGGIVATPAKLPNPTLPEAIEADQSLYTSPSSGQTVAASVCKLHLFNHIVCMEEELKRRMDYIEEQIGALELAFAQSSGSMDTHSMPSDPMLMKRTIGVLMDDLERVNKLVSI